MLMKKCLTIQYNVIQQNFLQVHSSFVCSQVLVGVALQVCYPAAVSHHLVIRRAILKEAVAKCLPVLLAETGIDLFNFFFMKLLCHTHGFIFTSAFVLFIADLVDNDQSKEKIFCSFKYISFFNHLHGCFTTHFICFVFIRQTAHKIEIK